MTPADPRTHSSRKLRLTSLRALLGLAALALGCATAEPPSPTADLADSPEIPEGYANQVIVETDWANLGSLRSALVSLDAEVAFYDHSTGTAWVRPGHPEGASLTELLSQVATVPGVVDAHLDPLMHGTGHDGTRAWSAGACAASEEPLDGPSMWHLAALRMAAAWEAQPDVGSVVVAVLDTGLTTDALGVPEAPGLSDTPVVAGYDFVGLDDDPDDDNGHGTMLTSVLAASGQLPGVAPGVSVLPVKVLDDDRMGSEAALAAGINFAVAAGADVVSMSLAFPTGFVPSGDLAQAVGDAAAAGVVLVAASGNHGTGEVAYPAAFGPVIAVGAARLTQPTHPVSLACAESKQASWIAKKTGRAEYSGFGAALDLCAPGGSIQHDLDGDGLPDAVPAMAFDPSQPGHYEPYLVAGTSPAAAEVAGLAALLRAAGAAPGEIRPLLQSTATSLGDAGFHTACGTGLADARFSFKRLAQGKIPTLPERFVNPVVTLAEDTAGMRRAVAFVEVVDELNRPVPDVTVVGHFRGVITHDVQAVTDDGGHVVMTSLAAPSDATMFEFGVDKIIEPGEGGPVVVVPRAFSRVELQSFRALSGFVAGGAGVEPSPFIVFIEPDALEPLLSDFGQDMIVAPDPSPPVLEPVRTIPPDVTSWSLVESLTTPTFGADAAPLTMAIDRQVLKTECAISDDILPIYSLGSGVEPSPFRLHDSLLRDPTTFQEVLVRPDQLFLDQQPVTEIDLGLTFGEQGVVQIAVEGSVCTPPSIIFADVHVWSDAVFAGDDVVDGGYPITVSDGLQTEQPGDPIDVGQTSVGASVFDGSLSTAASGTALDASAAVEGAGCGMQPVP